MPDQEHDGNVKYATQELLMHPEKHPKTKPTNRIPSHSSFVLGIYALSEELFFQTNFYKSFIQVLSKVERKLFKYIETRRSWLELLKAVFMNVEEWHNQYPCMISLGKIIKNKVMLLL